jgi:hypothetical protein
MRVVRKTPRSTGLSVEAIVGAAKERESTLSASVAKDGVAIEQLELEIAARRTNIDRTKEQLAETRGLRERLQEAIQNESRVGLSLLAPAEMARLQAEAAARQPPTTPSSNVVPPPSAEANAEAPVAPKSSSLAAPKPSAPPVPKTGAPPVLKKSLAPVSTPHSSMKPGAPPALANAEPGVANAGPVSPSDNGTASLPVLLDEADVHSEETAKWLSSAPGDS